MKIKTKKNKSRELKSSLIIFLGLKNIFYARFKYVKDVFLKYHVNFYILYVSV